MNENKVLNYIQNNKDSLILSEIPYDERRKNAIVLLGYGDRILKKYHYIFNKEELKEFILNNKEEISKLNSNQISILLRQFYSYDYILECYFKIKNINSYPEYILYQALYQNDAKIYYFNYLKEHIDLFDEKDFMQVIINFDNVDIKNREIKYFWDYIENPVFLGKIISSLNDNSLIEEYFNSEKSSDKLKAYIVYYCTDIELASNLYYKLDNSVKGITLDRFICPIDSDNFNDNEGYDKLVTFDTKNNIFINIMTDFIKNSSIQNISEYLSVITFLLPDYNEKYDVFLKILSERYNVNFNNLVNLCKLLKLEIIKNIHVENIQSILRMNENEFNKFLELFSDDMIEYDEYTLNNTIESLFQKVFTKEKLEIVNAFAYIKESFRNNINILDAETTFYRVCLGYENDIINNGYTKKSLLEALKNDDEEAYDFFNIIFIKYKLKERNEYVNREIIDYKSRNFDKEYDKFSCTQCILCNMEFNRIKDYLFRLSNLSDEEIKLISDEKVLEYVYYLKNNPSEINNVDSKEYKRKVYLFGKLLEKIYDTFKNEKEMRIFLNLYRDELKKKIVIPSKNIELLINLISEFDSETIKNKVIKDEVLFNKIKAKLKKYRLLAFDLRLEDLAQKADVSIDEINIYSLIVNFEEIMKSLNGKDFGLVKLLDEAESHSSISKIYSGVFGTENAKLIRTNPGNNSAPSTKKSRLDESVKNMQALFKKDKVTIPTFDVNYDLGNGKKINIVCGNFSNPINLTLGERTGSCLRSGGAGRDLYNFCINNENGFNIRFEDVDTHRLISRVSGFRNGNTVFLNELRESLDKRYSSEDLINIIEKVADILIQKSKDSKFPIENVIISNEMVMKSSKRKTTNIHVKNIAQGYDKLYYDIRPSACIVLKTTSKDSEFSSIKLGPNNVQKYDVIRDKVKRTKDINEVLHLEYLDDLLEGKKLEEKDFNEDEYSYYIVGEDFYVIVKKDNTYISKIIRNSKNPYIAQKELDSVLMQFGLKKYPVIEIVDEIDKDDVSVKDKYKMLLNELKAFEKDKELDSTFSLK